MTQTNQNKDYSWQWLDELIEDLRNYISHADDGIYLTANYGYKTLPEMEAETKAAIIAKIDEHYIGKGEAGDLNFREEFKKLKDLRNNRFMDEPEFDDLVEQLAADVHAHPTKDGYCCTCDADKAFIAAEVKQRCIEARLKLVEGAYIDQDVIYFRFPGGFADEYTMRQRLRDQLSTNNKDTLERSGDDTR